MGSYHPGLSYKATFLALALDSLLSVFQVVIRMLFTLAMEGISMMESVAAPMAGSTVRQ